MSARVGWSLDPAVTFLNHGSFGACPQAVLDEQARLRARLEAQPVRFMARDLGGLLDAARAEVAAFVGADPADLVFVSNATEGVNAVLRSLTLAPGDELLTTSHGYNAVKNALAFVAERSGARVVVAEFPFPLDSADAVVEAVLSRVGDRTRLAVLDHVTSPTGLVLPIERLVAALRERGVETLVDGAHAPGMLPLDLNALGAACFTGNGHKWLCGPKGAALLHVRRDRQEGVRPLVISHGATAPDPSRSRFLQEFDWTGTRDVTAALCLPTAIRTLGGALPGGWPALFARNRALALEGRALLCEALGIGSPAPDAMIGSLGAVPIGAARRPASSPLERDTLQAALDERHRIEVPVFPSPVGPGRILRISAQLYNERSDYERLAEVLPGLLAEGL